MYDYLKKLKDEDSFTPDRILDIGAWNGFWTNKVKQIWPDAHFTCIEAGPKHEQRLKEITADYHIAVLGDSNREVKMYLREIDKGNKKKVTYTKGSTLFDIFKDYELRQMQTLGELVGEDAQYDLIKQDVQGAEIMVMNGAPKIFKRAKYIIQEVNIHKDDAFPDMPAEKEMDDYMLDLGFKHNKIIERKDDADQLDKIYF
jgi:FkbM family methyltransferase|tara:strand:- start:1715 stop:2317 length:603 start_codon:yes stop_codon:yes gene_type:complete